MRTPLSNTPKSFAKNPYRIKGPLCCFRPEPRTQPHFSHSGYSQLFYSVPLPRSTVKGTKGDTAISFCYAFMSSRIGLGTPWCLKRFIFLPLKKKSGEAPNGASQLQSNTWDYTSVFPSLIRTCVPWACGHLEHCAHLFKI